MNTQDTTTEKKTKFNHEADNIWDATGITEERLDEICEKINKRGEKAERKSELIEMLVEETTHEELALMYHQLNAQCKRAMMVQDLKDLFRG